MNTIKVTYIAVHVDNYQGGSGAVYEKTILIDIDQDCPLKHISERVSEKIDSYLTSEYYCVENIRILNISIIEKI